MASEMRRMAKQTKDAKLAAEIHPGSVGQPEIQDDEIDARCYRLTRGTQRTCRYDVVTVAFEGTCKNILHVLLVINHKDAHDDGLPRPTGDRNHPRHPAPLSARG